MFDHISLLCFSASYAVALAFEITRMWFKSVVRSVVMLIFAGAGWIAQTMFLIARASNAPSGAAPFSSWFDWYLLAAWLLACFYLYLLYYHPRAPLGLVVLPLILGLIGVAAFLADRGPFPQRDASHLWGRVHGISLLVGTVSVSVGFVAGLMYLAQAYRLKHKLSPLVSFRLPSLEWLDRLNARALIVSTIFLGLGVGSGVVLNIIHRKEDQTAALPWNDPIVWTSALLFAWLAAVVVFNFFYRPARQGKKVAYLTVASFLFFELLLAVLLFAPTQHRVAPPSDAARVSQLLPIDSSPLGGRES